MRDQFSVERHLGKAKEILSDTGSGFVFHFYGKLNFGRIGVEFGRTPKINKNSGRDHYPRVFSVALAGGGITRGQVYGASDAFATAPEDNPLSVEDLATTVYDRIGIVADKELMAPGDRPMEIVDGGKVIKEICV